jgi:hypothetical protein
VKRVRGFLSACRQAGVQGSSEGHVPASRAFFQELIQYIWVGGYPRWKDEIRPVYVMAMKAQIDQSKNHLLDGLILRS